MDSTTRPPTTADDAMSDDVVSRLAIQIVASCQSDNPQSAGTGLISLPSERELSNRLQMSRHAVRNALSHLQRQGLLCRPNSRGPLLVAKSVPAVRRSDDGDLRCINFIVNSALDAQSLHWLRDEYLAGHTEVLEHKSVKTRYVVWDPAQENFESLLWCHAAPQFQGCLVMGRRDPALLNWLSDRAVPYVVQNFCGYDHNTLPPHHKVYVNKTGAASAATQRLLELGHRRIGFVGSLPEPDRLWAEYEGFYAAMRCAGYTPHSDDLIEMSTEVIQEAMGPCRRLLDRPDRPTAVVGGSGIATVSLMLAAQELGLELPRDLSVIGFDNVKASAYPDLSTIIVPRRALGRQAVELLLEAVETPTLPPQTRVLECQLNIQKTVGPVPG